MWFWVCKDFTIENFRHDRIRCNTMVSKSRTIIKLIIWILSRYVGDRMYFRWAYRWITVISWWKWHWLTFCYIENFRSFVIWVERSFIKKSKIFGIEVPWVLKTGDFRKGYFLNKIYLGKMSKKSLSLLKGLLALDPKERLTADEALRHPYFDGLNNNKNDG